MLLKYFLTSGWQTEAKDLRKERETEMMLIAINFSS
jgi:hypothetical protein